MSEKVELSEEQQQSPFENSAAEPLHVTSSSKADVGGSNDDANSHESKKTEVPEPSKVKQLWTKTGLSVPTIITMAKGAIPPTIALAMYQSDVVAAHYGILGYLVAIASVLGFCIMPRGIFIQTMALNIIAICFAAALNLLALFCITQARAHTTPPDQPPLGYNSSASAVGAVWLFVEVYCINVMRAARPQLQFPAILTSIFSIVSMTSGIAFPNMTTSIGFMKQLLEAFLTGFGLATGVHFFVFPLSSRTVVIKEMTGYINLLNGLLKTQTAYMASLEEIEFDELTKRHREQSARNKKNRTNDKTIGILTTPTSLKLQEVLNKLLELHPKLASDITPAKREVAIGKLESHDFTELWKLLRFVFVPITGLSTLMSILERRAELSGWDKIDVTEEEQKERLSQVENLHFLMKRLHKPFAEMTEAMDGAFQHVLITLEFTKPPKKNKDEESAAGDTAPGSPGFAEAYQKKVDAFYKAKQKSLREWCHAYGIELPPDFFESSFVTPPHLSLESERSRENHQRQLFFMLYLEHILWRSSVAALDLVIFVDKRKQEGAFQKSKVIFPGSKTLYKWIKSVLSEEDITDENPYTADLDSGAAQSLYLGEEFAARKDPEHLPPQNMLERIGDSIRKIPKFFRSDESAFGFRVAAATMSIAIANYLRDTQMFFQRQRLLWAMIMVAISMNRTAGQSTFNFLLRVFGTFVAMVGSFVVWYIVDGKTPGVLVFLFIFIACGFYVVVTWKKFLVIGIISVVTSILIIGYELQVRKIGKQAAESNGQPAYPIFLLAPYRLATVAGGLFVAFVWTIFPYPVSESSELRRDLGALLYLLSNMYSIAHETVRSRIKGIEGDESTKGTHGYNLDKARTKVFLKSAALISNLQTNSAFSKFQLRIGGKFPHEEYEQLIATSRRLLQWMMMISYASRTFQHSKNVQDASEWSHDFRELLGSVNPTSHKITSILSLLSSSISNGVPLPPYLDMPDPFQLAMQMQSINQDILSIRHIAEPEYSAFAVLQVVSQCINGDLVKLTEHVRNLVGEIDFTFHAVKSSAASSDSSSVDSEGKGKLE